MGVITLAWMGISLMALAQAPATTEPDQTSAKIFSPESLLPNFVEVDPTDGLANAVDLAPNQIEHMRQCYASYRDAAPVLGRRVQEQVDKEGHWAEKARLGEAAPPDVVRKSAESMQRARVAVRTEYLDLERQLFDCMTSVVSESQATEFHHAALAAQRASWLEIGSKGMRQDFIQFGDSLAAPLDERAVLQAFPDVLNSLEAVITQGETDLQTSLPVRWCEWWDTRSDSRIARASGDERRIRESSLAFLRQWNHLYRLLETTNETGAAALENVGHPDAARRSRERFWAGCFPNLIGNELTPAIFAAIKSDPKQLDAEQLAVIEDLRSRYLADRHELLRRAVQEHVRNYMDLDLNERNERLTGGFFGSSSPSVATIQLKRCELSLQARQKLNEIAGGLEPFLKSEIVLDAEKSAIALDNVLFDKPETIGILNERMDWFKRIEQKPAQQ